LHLLAALLTILVFVLEKKNLGRLLWVVPVLFLALHLGTAERSFSQLWTADPLFTPSVAFDKGWIGAKEFFEHRLILILVLTCGLMALLERKFSRSLIFCLMAYLTLLLPFWNEHLSGYALRSLRSAPLVALYLTFFTFVLLREMWGKTLFSILVLLLLLSLSFSKITGFSGYGGIGPQSLVPVLVEQRVTLQEYIPRDALVIAPHGVQFQVTYLLQRSSTTDARAGIGKERFMISRNNSPGRCAPFANANEFDSRCYELDTAYIIKRGN